MELVKENINLLLNELHSDPGGYFNGTIANRRQDNVAKFVMMPPFISLKGRIF